MTFEKTLSNPVCLTDQLKACPPPISLEILATSSFWAGSLDPNHVINLESAETKTCNIMISTQTKIKIWCLKANTNSIAVVLVN